MRRRAIAVAALTAATGCGSVEPDKPTGKDVIAAAERTTATPAGITQNALVRTGAHEHVDYFVDGSVDGRHRTADLTVETKRKGRGPVSAAARRLDAFDGRIVHAGRRTYVRSRSLNRRFGLGAGRWIVFDRAARRARALSPNVPFGAMDPTRPVDHLRALVADEEADRPPGSDGSVYLRVTVDLERYLEMTPPAARDVVADSVQRYRRASGGTRVTQYVSATPGYFVDNVDSRLVRAGRVVLSYDIVIRTKDRRRPAIPRHAVPLRKLARR